jgi:SAM-dependent methyltransferase
MAESLNEINSCEVCGDRKLRSVLDLGRHPMCDDLVQVGDTRVCKEYPIEILYCDTCATAHQKYQIPKHELFPKTYHYRSRHTADVLNGMRQLVEEVGARLGSLEGKKVIDIGCNDGSLLSFFVEAGAKTFGIEPTDAAKEAAERGHVVIQDFLTEDTAKAFVVEHGKPDIITFTNVFAHIEDLQSVIRALKILSHDETTLVVENHYLGAVLDKRQFDTFYHEHPRTYSYRSFCFIADTMGKRIISAEFPKRYGGNIRVIVKGPMTAEGHDSYAEVKAIEDGFGERLEKLARDIDTWKARKRTEIREAIKRYGKLNAKAFPGRSAISVKLLGLDENMIDRVFEKPTSAKVGHYVPGTRIVIASDDDFDAAKLNAPILNLAWHIAAPRLAGGP